MAEPRRRGILSGPIEGPWREVRAPREVTVERGLVVTHLASRFTGKVVGVERGGVRLRSLNTGMERLFALHRGSFAVGKETVTLVLPAATRSGTATRIKTTASGSLAVSPGPARVARPSRILVEGVHDAELVEKVWGDDLRAEGVVVERLDGLDHLPRLLPRYAPGPGCRIGVLVDHLVPGSKERRVAEEMAGPYVMFTGTPFVDVWQAVRPAVVGLGRWPDIPRNTVWKAGICARLGEPDQGRMWRRILGAVRSYADLEPELVNAVERLIDFVTEPQEDCPQ